MGSSAIVGLEPVLAYAGAQGQDQDFVLLDVRRAADIVTRGSIPGAKFFSIAELYSTSGTYVGATVLVKILAAQGIGTADPVDPLQLQFPGRRRGGGAAAGRF